MRISASPRMRLGLAGLGFTIFYILIFGKSINFEFLSWDDDLNITSNRWVSLGDLSDIWSHAYYGMYFPVTYTFWTLLAQFSGHLEPAYFHAANLTFHFCNTLLAYLLISEILPKCQRSS